MTKEQLHDYEANIYATTLLIPKDLLLKEIKKMGGLDLGDDKNWKAICKKFQVTSSAMAFRLFLLDKKEVFTRIGG